MTMPDTQPLTDRSLVVAKRFQRITFNNKAKLGLADVWFGDQRMLRRTPSLCVEPGFARRELKEAQNRTHNDIDTVFLLYHSPVSEMQASRAEAIRAGELLVNYLERNHLRLFDAAGNQLTIHGHGVEIDPGFAFKQNTLYHAVQITWRSISRTLVSYPWPEWH